MSGGRRGYDGRHKNERARWAPVVAAGAGYCHAARCLMPSRQIAPGTPWDLGHTPDRLSWTGPEHARCNRSAGQAVAAAQRRGRPPANLAALIAARRGQPPPPRRTLPPRAITPGPAPLLTSRKW